MRHVSSSHKIFQLYMTLYTKGNESARSNGSMTKRKTKVVTMELLTEALYRGDFDDMEADVKRKAEAERQRLMESIAATRVRREEVHMRAMIIYIYIYKCDVDDNTSLVYSQR
jgi:hypothetical protein